jgi:hypothetical protein
MHHLHAELREGSVDKRELLGRAVFDHDVATGDCAKREALIGKYPVGKGANWVEIVEFEGTSGN